VESYKYVGFNDLGISATLQTLAAGKTRRKRRKKALVTSYTCIIGLKEGALRINLNKHYTVTKYNLIIGTALCETF
jgi:hypothetical protein